MFASGVFVGDELSAAGYRLAGMDARVPSPGDETACFARALEDGSIVLVGARCARAIAPAVLDDALALLSPLVIVVPDWDGTSLTTAPASKVRRILGLET